MLPEGICVHATPNRLRIRFPDRKRDGDFFAALGKQFAGCTSVKAVQTNARTGSLLLLHEGEMDKIVNYAAEKRIFTVSPNSLVPSERPVSQTLVQQFKQVNNGMKRLSGNALDLPETIVLVLVGSGLYQIARGNFAAPAWYTCIWYGMNIFLKNSHSDQASEHA